MMSGSTTKRKKAAPAATPITTTTTTTTTSQSNVINNLLESYEFLAPNEYSEKTIGIQAFLLRKSVGDINFSDIIDDSEKRNRQGQTANCVGILEDKRYNLPEIDASVEKCLMLNRLIYYIRENESRFTSLISDIRLEMQLNMTDTQSGPATLDFRQREHDFNARKHAQNIRRLFYHSNLDVKQPPNLVYLQNRTTEQLSYITNQLKGDSKSRQTLTKELETIFLTSFLIVAQPHSGVNPVTIYERRGPGEYTAKISVTIISLLYDFMQLHPNLIELYDIEPSLCPASQYYKLEEPRAISWKTCQIQTAVGGKARTFLCAELSAITIEQSSKTDTRVRFAQLLHSFKFAIKLQFNLAENNKSPIYQFPLESLQFGIGAHNNQIPQLLTRVLLDDIRKFNENALADVKILQNYIQRYFIHRTGVQPNECVNIYLEQELTKAMNQRSSFESLEDIYMDFLVNFVHQVEFMAKHPILSMFHADGLFLGICNSERAAEAIVQSSVSGSPVIELRFNSIRVDYNTIATLASSSRTVKLPPCAVRVDIYNDRTKKLQNRTFDSSILATDISKFVLSAHTDDSSRIRVLSNFDDRANGKNYLSFNGFAKYYHKRLQEISKSDEKYKPVTDLVENANDGNTDEDIIDHNSDIFQFGPNSVASITSLTSNFVDSEQSSDGLSNHGYMSISYDSSNQNAPSPQSVLSPSNHSQQQQQQQPPLPSGSQYVNNQEAILQFVLSQPNLAEQVVRQFGNGIYNTTTQIESSPVQYQIQPSPYRQQVPMQIPQQRQSLPSQMSFQQPSHQSVYHQPQTQIYHPSQIQFQPSIPQQPQPYLSQQQQQPQPYFSQHPQQVLFQQQVQRPASSSVIHYLPNNINQPTFVPQTQQYPTFQTNGTDHIPQQFLEKINVWNISDVNVNQTTTDSIQQPITTNQAQTDTADQELQQFLTSGDLEQILAQLESSQATENKK